MGFDRRRIVGEVLSDLICSKCEHVMCEPLQVTSSCGHTFCADCILPLITESNLCPVDSEPVSDPWVETSHMAKALIEDLDIGCDFAAKGCTTVVKVRELGAHCIECPMNPEALVTCEKVCVMPLKRREVASHSCLTALSALLRENARDIQDMKRELKYMTNDKARLELIITNLDTELKRAKQGWIIRDARDARDAGVARGLEQSVQRLQNQLNDTRSALRISAHLLRVLMSEIFPTPRHRYKREEVDQETRQIQALKLDFIGKWLTVAQDQKSFSSESRTGSSDKSLTESEAPDSA